MSKFTRHIRGHWTVDILEVTAHTRSYRAYQKLLDMLAVTQYVRGHLIEDNSKKICTFEIQAWFLTYCLNTYKLYITTIMKRNTALPGLKFIVYEIVSGCILLTFYSIATLITHFFMFWYKNSKYYSV